MVLTPRFHCLYSLSFFVIFGFRFRFVFVFRSFFFFRVSFSILRRCLILKDAILLVLFVTVNVHGKIYSFLGFSWACFWDSLKDLLGSFLDCFGKCYWSFVGLLLDCLRACFWVCFCDCSWVCIAQVFDALTRLRSKARWEVFVALISLMAKARWEVFVALTLLWTLLKISFSNSANRSSNDAIKKLAKKAWTSTI